MRGWAVDDGFFASGATPLAPSGWPSAMAPMRVHSHGIGIQRLKPRKRDRRECLVHFIQVDVPDSQSSSCKRPLRSCDRCLQHDNWVACGNGHVFTRAMGSTQSERRPRALAIRTAEAPSQIWLEVAAVSRPSSRSNLTARMGVADRYQPGGIARCPQEHRRYRRRGGAPGEDHAGRCRAIIGPHQCTNGNDRGSEGDQGRSRSVTSRDRSAQFLG